MVKLLTIALLASACGSTTGTPIPDAQNIAIQSIAVTPMTNAVTRGIDEPKLTAMATLGNGTMKDVTASAMWSTSDSAVATVDAGRVVLLGNGAATVTATAAGVSGMATFTVRAPQMFITETQGMIGVDVFDAYQAGNVAPLRQITGASTTLAFPWGIATTDTEIFVADGTANAIDVYPLAATGNVAPTRRITGATTTLSSSYSLALFNNEIYVTSANKILVFPTSGTGDIAPTRSISGAATLLGSAITGLAIDNGELYVFNAIPTSVEVFPLDATNNVAPSRVITGPHTLLTPGYGGFIYNGEIVVSTGTGLRAFAETATGDIAPLRSVIGPDTATNGTGVTRLGHEMYNVDFSAPSVQVIDLEATSDAAPKRVVSGALTTLTSPRTISFH